MVTPFAALGWESHFRSSPKSGQSTPLAECPLRVNRVVSSTRQLLPVYPKSRTYRCAALSDARGHFRTHAPRQKYPNPMMEGSCPNQVRRRACIQQISPAMTEMAQALLKALSRISGVLAKRKFQSRGQPSAASSMQTRAFEKLITLARFDAQLHRLALAIDCHRHFDAGLALCPD
jgi:hypothetical protein